MDCTNVYSMYTSSRAQVCAWSSAHPGMTDGNKGVKNTQSWNSAGRNCKNMQCTALCECLVDYEFWYGMVYLYIFVTQITK